jgi:hypothetical protein
MKMIGGNKSDLASMFKEAGLSPDLINQIGEDFDLKDLTSNTGNKPKITTKVIPQDIIVETPIIIKKGIDATEDNKMLKLKQELSDLIQLKEIINETDFEGKVNVSTLIHQTQKQIDKINSGILELSMTTETIFDKLFSQSFNSLNSRYDDTVSKRGNETNIAPDGSLSDLNDDVQKLIKSDLFKEWFGDFQNAYSYRNFKDLGGLSVSRVLSPKFEPLIVWHGTGQEFSYFRFDNFPAAYFAENRNYSDFFAEMHSKDGIGYVLPFFLSIKKPLDFTIFGISDVSTKDFFDWIYLQTGLEPQELDINPLFLSPTAPPSPVWVYLRNNAKMIKKIADSRVFDGIEFYEFNPNLDPSNEAYSTKAFIIFDPHQAKLADPRRGNILLNSLQSFLLEKGGKI